MCLDGLIPARSVRSRERLTEHLLAPEQLTVIASTREDQVAILVEHRSADILDDHSRAGTVDIVPATRSSLRASFPAGSQSGTVGFAVGPGSSSASPSPGS
jgi:hypothetical protein